MSSEEFVTDLKKALVDYALESYKEVITKTDNAEVTSPFWKQFLEVYNYLDSNKKDVLFNIVRSIQVDTISGFLGILDGSSWLNNQNLDLVLTVKGTKEPLNGDLQETFLETESE